jgi:hypothetical protein
VVLNRAIRVGLLLLLGYCAVPNLGYGQDLGDMLESVGEQPWLSFREAEEREDEDEESIETDRDSFTPSTTVAGLNRTIFEASYSFIDNRAIDNSHSFPEIITRIGIMEGVELRVGWNFETGGGGEVSGGDPGGDPETHGPEQESQVLYGLKIRLTEQVDWLPQSSVIIQGTTPTSGPDSYSDFQLGYVFGWMFMDDWQLDASLRYIATTEERNQFSEWAPSIVLKIPVAEKWNVHAEYFGIMTDGRAVERCPQYFSPGIHYLVTPNCEIGVRTGWGISKDASNFFSNVGLGLRF